MPTYKYTCAGPGEGAHPGCNFEFSSETLSAVRKEARGHLEKAHGERTPEPVVYEFLIKAA
jgi:predicted small metal-binding protein